MTPQSRGRSGRSSTETGITRAGGEANTQVETELGRRIRAERERAQLTIEEVAQRSGYSLGYISQVERGTANPSLSALKGIAHAVGVKVSTFFGWERVSADNGSRAHRQEASVEGPKLVPSDRRKKLVYPGSSIHHELLSPDLRGRMEVIWVTAPPGVDSGDEPHIHEGEETNVVLRGRAEFRVGGRVFVLGPGDALTLPASIAHTWRSLGSENLEMIWVTTPPTF